MAGVRYMLKSTLFIVTWYCVNERFFTTLDILTNVFLNSARQFFTMVDILTMNKAQLFIKAQLKPVKITSRI